MDKLLAVLKREFLERVRTKWFLIATLLGPVFFAAITILPAWMAIRERGSSTVADVTIIDATGTGLGDRIARALADSVGNGPKPNVVTVAPEGLPAAETAATASVVRKERRGYLVLDTSALNGRSARYAGRNASSLADVDRLREVVQRQVLAARLEREGLDAQRVTSLTGTRFRMPTERITEKGRGGGSGAGNALVAVVVAFLLYMMILLYGQNVLRSVLEEKTTRVAEVIVASVKPDILMAGKVIGVGAVGIVQVIAWFGGAILIGGYVAPFLKLPSGGAPAGGPAAQVALGGMPGVTAGVLVSALIFFLLGYLLYSSLFAAAGAMVSSEQEAQQAALPVMLPLIASAVFIQVVLRNPDATGAKVLSWFPLTAPIIMPMRMSLTTISALEITLVVLGVMAACVLSIWVAARIYRVGLLMYGKKPTLPELVRWVRQAA